MRQCRDRAAATAADNFPESPFHIAATARARRTNTDARRTAFLTPDRRGARLQWRKKKATTTATRHKSRIARASPGPGPTPAAKPQQALRRLRPPVSQFQSSHRSAAVTETMEQ